MCGDGSEMCDIRSGRQYYENNLAGCKSHHFCLTLISAVVEDVEGVHCLLAPLLVTEDQVNPLMEVTGHMLTLLEFKIQVVESLSRYRVLENK